MQGQDRSTNYN